MYESHKHCFEGKYIGRPFMIYASYDLLCIIFL